jgi:branched-chain amino acid transport system permease protein
VLAFMISAAMMSVAGTFYAQYVLVLDPERLFSAEISIIVLLMTVLGGSGTLWGPALGAFTKRRLHPSEQFGGARI